MKSFGSNVRSWSPRQALPAVCALLLTLSAVPGSAGSLGGFNGFPGQNPSPAPVGTVLTVPMGDLGPIMAANIVHMNNVNLLQLSQTAIGDLNSQVATVSIRQQNWLAGGTPSPATTCWLPTAHLDWIKQANRDCAIIQQSVYGFGSMQMSQVMVQQQNTGAAAPGTRFLLCPLSGLGSLLALNQRNVNLVHISQLAVGSNDSQVALVSVDQQNAHSLQVPGTLLEPLVQLNMNLTVINQVAVGNGNTQLATVDVGQTNALAPPAS